MNYKYVVIDFGNVIARPTSGHWTMTPKFKELIDVDKIDMDLLKDAIKRYMPILSQPIDTVEKEYEMYKEYYQLVLADVNYTEYDDKIIDEIAYDRAYKNDKYTLFDGVIEELKELKNKYTLLLLSDNSPSVFSYMKDNNIYDLFDKIYVSSIYGSTKGDKVFFDYPINDYNIKPGEALFIDDFEGNLDIAKEKGFDVLLMDRFNKGLESKYKIINDLKNL